MCGSRLLSSWVVRMLLPVALLALPAAEGEAQAPARAPNILLIVGDDHGYPYAGFMGNEIVETPHLDALAAAGTTFTHAFAPASICRPALQTLLSGLQPARWAAERSRLEEARGEPLPTRSEVRFFPTLPRQLARQGYRSFQGGKHWEGDFAMAGFDAGTSTELVLEGSGAGHDTFGRTTLSPLADFLDALEPGEPFFALAAPMLPHTPLDPPEELILRYLDVGWLSLGAILYYANVTRLDDTIGAMLAMLDERGLRDDTLVIYVSDNGWEQAPDRDHFLGLVLGGDRGKASSGELGFRSPLVFRWPGVVPAGRVLDDLVTFEDLHATLLRYAGAPLPPDHRGFDLRPRIHAEPGAVPARDHVLGHVDRGRSPPEQVDPARPSTYTRHDPATWLRTAGWRYVEWTERGEHALYRIEEDPFEADDRSAAHPALVDWLALGAYAFRRELEATSEWMDVTGQLSDPQGRPASGLRLWLEAEGEERSRWQTLSDARGFFRFANVRAGGYTLVYELEPAESGSERWLRRRAAPATRRMALDLERHATGPFLPIALPAPAPAPPGPTGPKGVVELSASLSGGAAAVGQPVHLLGWTTAGWVEQRALTGGDGFVALDRLPSGRYALTVGPVASRHATRRAFDLGPGATVVLRVRVPDV